MSVMDYKYLYIDEVRNVKEIYLFRNIKIIICNDIVVDNQRVVSQSKN